jgi:hypothetical protein
VSLTGFIAYYIVTIFDHLPAVPRMGGVVCLHPQ